MKRYISKISIIIAIVALAGLSSCHIVKKYESPEVESEELFREEPLTDAQTIADIPWSEYFSDPLLVNLIEEGLQNNFDMRSAYYRIKQAEAALSVARSAYFPSVALVGQVEQTRLSLGVRDNKVKKDVLGYPTTNYTLGISVTWEADLWGKLTRQKKAQVATLLNSYEYRNLVQTSLIANIATTYYTLLALDEQLAVTENTLGLLAESTATMEALMEAGLLTGASVEQSRALYYSTLVTVPDLKAAIWQTENAMCLMLGRIPGPIHRSTIDEQSVSGHMDHGVPAQMLARRPDVLSAELSFRSAFELTQAARASFYPSITLGTGSMFGYATQNTLSQFFKPEHLFANIIGGITQPIFARKQLNANLKVAKAQQQEALIAFEQAVINAGREVSDILYSYRASMSKNETRRLQLESLTTAVYFTQELLVAGEANYTEVLSAEQNLLQARLGEVSDKLEQLQYSVTLYKALGGGTF